MGNRRYLNPHLVLILNHVTIIFPPNQVKIVKEETLRIGKIHHSNKTMPYKNSSVIFSGDGRN